MKIYLDGGGCPSPQVLGAMAYGPMGGGGGGVQVLYTAPSHTVDTLLIGGCILFQYQLGHPQRKLNVNN